MAPRNNGRIHWLVPLGGLLLAAGMGTWFLTTDLIPAPEPTQAAAAADSIDAPAPSELPPVSGEPPAPNLPPSAPISAPLSAPMVSSGADDVLRAEPSEAPSPTRAPEAPSEPEPPTATPQLALQGGAPDHALMFASLIRRNPEVALGKMIELSKEVRGDPAQEQQIAELLALLPGQLDPGTVGRVNELYDGGGDRIQVAAARLLAASGDDRLQRRFIDDRRESLGSRDATTRADTAWSIGRVGGSYAVEQLTSLLRDSSEEVLLSALNGLLSCDGCRSAGAVRPLLEHAKHSVSSLAAAALERWEAEARERSKTASSR